MNTTEPPVVRGCSRASALPLKRRSARLRADAEPRVHSRLVRHGNRKRVGSRSTKPGYRKSNMK